MPQALPAIMAVVSIASTALQTAAQVKATRANASMAKFEADSIQRQTEIEQASERKRNQETLSRQTSIAAASGVDPNSGSPLATALDTAFEGEMNALKIGYSGELKRQGKLYESKIYKSQIPGLIMGGVFKGIQSGAQSYFGSSFGGGGGGSGSLMGSWLTDFGSQAKFNPLGGASYT